MAKPPKVLLQLDSDPHPSVFDAVVAVDAGVDQLLQYAPVEPTQVEELVHGAMFTRAPDDLCRTAIFIGGANVVTGEALLQQVTSCFFEPLRVSVMLDANGANTTAAAAVLAASRHVDLSSCEATVLGATGPVGQRVVRLLARRNARVRVCSRNTQRAQMVFDRVLQQVPDAQLTACAVSSPQEAASVLEGAKVVFSAGAAGVELLPDELRQGASTLEVVIDLNAVPPLGIGGVKATDKAKDRNGQICYGAIGVGGLKMKIHKAAIKSLFKTNDQILDAEQILKIGEGFE